jgi:hypothetical protein
MRERATDGRSQRCEHCNGMVKAKRRQTLDEVLAVHAEVCPGRKR